MKIRLLFHLTASGFYTSVCLASLCLCTDIILLNSKPNWLYFAFIFFTTFFYYNFHKIEWYQHQRIFDKENLKYQWPSHFPGFLFLSLIISFVACASLITICITNYKSFLLGGLACLNSLFYNHKLLGVQLRVIKGLKAFVISLVSVITTVLIPCSNFNEFSHTIFFKVTFFTLAQFLFISALCITADIRDTTEDHEDGIKTYPVILGISTSKKLVLVMLLLNILLLYIMLESDYLSFKHFEMLSTITLLSILFTNQLNTKSGYYLFVILIDGLILCQAICALLLKFMISI